MLGGRSFDVLMTRMPLQVIHKKLDEAGRSHPERGTLAEFRAPDWIALAEEEALAAAQKVVSPHSEIQRLFSDKVTRLTWHLPAKSLPSGQRRVIAFPGPTAARKGAYELRSVARAMDLDVLLLGSVLEGLDFWQGVRAKRVDKTVLQEAAIVAQPALLEDNPRALLKALAMGLPVIATQACGLAEFPQVIQIPYGDEDALRNAIREQLEISANTR